MHQVSSASSIFEALWCVLLFCSDLGYIVHWSRCSSKDLHGSGRSILFDLQEAHKYYKNSCVYLLWLPVRQFSVHLAPFSKHIQSRDQFCSILFSLQPSAPPPPVCFFCPLLNVMNTLPLKTLQAARQQTIPTSFFFSERWHHCSQIRAMCLHMSWSRARFRSKLTNQADSTVSHVCICWARKEKLVLSHTQRELEQQLISWLTGDKFNL